MSDNNIQEDGTSLGEKLAYYRSAIRGLRYVEQRRPTDRRFGPEADARWASFRGELTVASRIDLLIRDADTEWPGAFGPRRVFSLRAAAEDEPFGSEWSPLTDRMAIDLWREETGSAVPADLNAELEAVASVWDVRLRPVEAPDVAPADRLAVAGPSAIAAVALTFASGEGLAWHEQIVCVAEVPPHRQIAAMAAALLNAQGRTLLVGDESDPEVERSARRAVTSDDATEGERRLAEEIAGDGSG